MHSSRLGGLAPSERIGRCTRMLRFFVRFNRPESFVHTRSSAGFTIITSGFEFSVHTPPQLAVAIIPAASACASGLVVPPQSAAVRPPRASGNPRPLFFSPPPILAVAACVACQNFPSKFDQLTAPCFELVVHAYSDRR